MKNSNNPQDQNRYNPENSMKSENWSLIRCLRSADDWWTEGHNLFAAFGNDTFFMKELKYNFNKHIFNI